MATNTASYNFKKPDESDFYSVQDQNGNWDKADAALKDLDTPAFEDYTGSTTVPDAATAINNIRSKGKLSTLLSNIKAAFKGVCLIGQIVNNCVTNNASLPLSAAQGKILMDMLIQTNSNLGVIYKLTPNGATVTATSTAKITDDVIIPAGTYLVFSTLSDFSKISANIRLQVGGLDTIFSPNSGRFSGTFTTLTSNTVTVICSNYSDSAIAFPADTVYYSVILTKLK